MRLHFRRAVGALLCLIFSASCSKSQTGPTNQNELIFKDRPQEVAPIADPESSPAVRERSVEVNLESIRKLTTFSASAERTLTGSNQILLPLFDDANLMFDIHEAESLGDSNVILSGRIDRDPDSSATLVMKDGVLVGNIKKDGRGFEIRLTRNGTQIIRELDPSAETFCDADRLPVEPSDLPDAALQRIDGGPQAMVAATDVKTMDQMVAYTPSALRGAGNVAALEAMIQMAVADTNQAFQDSGVPHRVRLVGILPLSQTETGDWSADIAALKSTNDGKWDEVHAARQKFGADQVSMLISQSGSIAGIGYIGPSKSAMFTISTIGALSQYTFSHELGHNLSLQHSDGLESSSGRFRTIMAYGSQKRIRRYSNPDLTFNGMPTGTTTQNSVAKLLKSIPAAAVYLAALTPEPTPTPTPTPTPSPVPGAHLAGLVLVNAMGMQTPISDGGELTIKDGQAFSIQAKTSSDVTRVRFSVKISRNGFSSTRSFTDSSAPFVALDQSQAQAGTCTITATTNAGDSLTVTFRVVSQP